MEQISLKVGITGGNDIVKVANSVNALERNIMKLSSSFQKNNISSKALFKGLQAQIATLRRLGMSYKEAHKAVYDFYNAQKMATTATMAATKANNRMGVVTQQAGYQVSDFIVQVQSGTNVFVAFSQQASQLAGVLPLVADQLGLTASRAIKLSAALGIAIPIIGAIGAAYLNMKRNAKEAASANDKLKETFDKIKEALDKIGEIDIASSLEEGMLPVVKEIRQEFETSLKIAKELAAIQLKEALNQPLLDLREQFRKYETLSNLSADTEFDILGFKDPERFIQVYEILNGIQGDTREELQKSVEESARWLQGSGLLNDQVKKILAEYVRVVGTVKTVKNSVEETSDGVNEQTNKAKRLKEEYEEILKIKDLEFKLLGKEFRYGKDSLQYRLAKIEYEKELYKLEIDRAGFSAEQQRELIRAFNANLDIQYFITSEERKQVDLVEEMNYQYDSVKDTIDDINEGLEEANRLQTIMTSYNLGPAMRRAMDRYGGRSTVSDKKVTYGSGPNEGKSVDYTPPPVRESDLEKLQKAIKLERELFGMSDARKRVVEALGLEYSKNNPKIVDGLVEQLNQIESLTRAEEERQKTIQKTKDLMNDTAESIGDSFGRALENIVDGTYTIKDAFRVMAADIIKELYRIYVVKQITGMISDAFSLFTGPAPGSSGSIMGGPRANGGPVEMGKTYLVGERGPELFTAPTNGKITPNEGLGGNVVVNQTINVSTGVQQTVRTEIKQLMPAIADSAKKAVLDGKRRGGSYGKAFG